MTQRLVSGAAIKAIREAKKLQLRDVAIPAGIDATRLCRFETGERTPSASQAQAIADALGVPLAAISFATRVVIVTIPETDATDESTRSAA